MRKIEQNSNKKEGVWDAVNEMKAENGPGLFGLTVECSKKCGMSVLELLRPLNECFELGEVPTYMDWCGA